MATRSIVLAFAAILALPLAACDTVQKDIQASAASTRSIFTDFSMDKLLAATPAKPEEKQFSLAGTSFKAVRAEMQVEEEIIPGGKQMIPVPESRPERSQAAASALKPSACPDVRIVGDLNQVHQFAGRDTAPAESVSSIWMQDVTQDCKIGSKNISVEMTLAFEGVMGPKGKAHKSDKPSFAYPYFVAITNNQGNIVAKEVFAVTLTYEEGKTADTKVEKVRQIIPVASTDMRNYKILVGFQLNDEELAYNRALPSEVTLKEIAPAAGQN